MNNLIYPVGAQQFWIPAAPGVPPRCVTRCHLQGFEGDLKLNATETGLESALIKATRDGTVSRLQNSLRNKPS